MFIALAAPAPGLSDLLQSLAVQLCMWDLKILLMSAKFGVKKVLGLETCPPKKETMYIYIYVYICFIYGIYE